MKARIRIYLTLLFFGLAIIGITTKAELAVNQFYIDQIGRGK